MGKKIFRKILIAIAAILVIYIVVLLITGFYIGRNKPQIMNYASQVLKENLKGELAIEDIDISVWKKFPFISFTVVNLSWKDSVLHAPILSLKSVSSTFNIFQVFFSSRTIRNLHIEKGMLRIFTDSTGYSNGYLMQVKNKISAKQEKSQNGAINIDDLSISDLEIVIEDQTKRKRSQ